VVNRIFGDTNALYFEGFTNPRSSEGEQWCRRSRSGAFLSTAALPARAQIFLSSTSFWAPGLRLGSKKLWLAASVSLIPILFFLFLQEISLETLRRESTYGK
jgi:hypothetical protein